MFEKTRIFERQGQLGLAKEIATSTPTGETPVVDQNLVACARAYVQCFTDGAWVDALQEVYRIFESFLAVDCRLDSGALIVSDIGARSFN